MQAARHFTSKLYVAITLQSKLLQDLPRHSFTSFCPVYQNQGQTFGIFFQMSKKSMSNVPCVRGNNVMEVVNTNHVNGTSSISVDESKPVLSLKKVVIVGKMTRYEFEKQRFEGYSEDQFREALQYRGSDYDALYEQHMKHMKTLSSIKNVLNERGIEFQVCTRGRSYTMDLINWADAIITAGGDGTFLSAASKIRDQSKPVIGINTNPNRSEGHICLPTKYTTDLGKALDKLASGQFKWLWRQRIRITMTGLADNFRQINSGDVLRTRMSSNNLASLDESEFTYRHDIMTEVTHHSLQSSSGVSSQVLPVLALNEVFIGEALAAVPSFYEITIDDEPSEQQKSSGLCICSGTGSTAWSYNICRLPERSVRTVLELAAQAISSEGSTIANEINGSKQPQYPKIKDNLVKKVTEAYSHSFLYEPDSEKMLFSVRDPMRNRVFNCTQSHGFAKKIVLRSRCWDAALCIDGEISFAFNDGAVATLEMLPTDALRTVVLTEEDEPVPSGL